MFDTILLSTNIETRDVIKLSKKFNLIKWLREVHNMAVPKRKTSKARKNKRRSNVWKISAPALVKCPACGEFKLPHRVCLNCGKYNNREVFAVES